MYEEALWEEEVWCLSPSTSVRSASLSAVLKDYASMEGSLEKQMVPNALC